MLSPHINIYVFLICEVRWFEEGHVVDITECFVQMLEKDQCETLKFFHHHLQLVYNLQRLILYQNLIRSLLGTISFIQEFIFDIK